MVEAFSVITHNLQCIWIFLWDQQKYQSEKGMRRQSFNSSSLPYTSGNTIILLVFIFSITIILEPRAVPVRGSHGWRLLIVMILDLKKMIRENTCKMKSAKYNSNIEWKERTILKVHHKNKYQRKIWSVAFNIERSHHKISFQPQTEKIEPPCKAQYTVPQESTA